MNVRLLVHLAMRMDMVDEQQITAEVFREKRESYEEELTAQARNVGCNRQGVMDEKTMKQAHDQSAEEGAGIVNTYNYDLAYAINNIHDQFPTANRVTYAKYLGQWDQKRASWKNVQISLHNRMEWKAKAAYDFTRNNNVEGYAILVPDNKASCAICRGWIKRGKVPLAEAQRVMQGWPPHINCIHSWNVKPLGDLRCEELWVGAEPLGYPVKRKEMIIPVMVVVDG